MQESTTNVLSVDDIHVEPKAARTWATLLPMQLPAFFFRSYEINNTGL